MSASASADPVRIEVEEALRRVFDRVTAIPCSALRRVKRATETPVGLVRSVVELTLNNVLGGGSKRPGPAPAQQMESPRPAPLAESSDPSNSPVIDGDPHDASTELPLHGYESLAASQVVARLYRLDPDELELIRAF